MAHLVKPKDPSTNHTQLFDGFNYGFGVEGCSPTDVSRF